MIKDLFLKRRSYRKFSAEEISENDVQFILRAALLSPSSRGRCTWHFVVVEDKLDLEKLADAKSSGSGFLKNCRLAVVVCGDALENDCWLEDGAIAAYGMLLQAEDLGLGACWCQIHKRLLADGTSSEDVVRGVLDIPENQNVLCIVGIGHKETELAPQDEDTLKWENVHLNKW
ncbi:MAG: nitroreductase family protein [Bacteroidaceae bacterium]|nr:nitroreductase family protein [Bacteroidaceae bacterium]